jgi:hypothetical protein
VLSYRFQNTRFSIRINPNIAWGNAVEGEGVYKNPSGVKHGDRDAINPKQITLSVKTKTVGKAVNVHITNVKNVTFYLE